MGSAVTRTSTAASRFYVEIPDVEAALAKAESLGGTRIVGARTRWEALSSWASSPTPKAT